MLDASQSKTLIKLRAVLLHPGLTGGNDGHAPQRRLPSEQLCWTPRWSPAHHALDR
jgi:hypothetical protein